MSGVVMRISDCRPGPEGSLESRCVPAVVLPPRYFLSLYTCIFSFFFRFFFARRLLAWPRVFGRLEHRWAAACCGDAQFSLFCLFYVSCYFFCFLLCYPCSS